MGAHLWNENRNRYPAEKLLAYAGQVVAWYPDGSGIREAGPDMEVVRRRIEESGEDPWPYVLEYIEPLGSAGGG
jgi:hypothetical protein